MLELFSFFEDSNYVYLVLEMCHIGEMYRYMKETGQPFSEDQGDSYMFESVYMFTSWSYQHMPLLV